MDEKGPWILGFGGLILTAVCCTFQTMGFEYVPFTTCLEAVLIGFLIAFIVIYYLYRQTKPTSNQKKIPLSEEQFSRFMRNIGIMFVVVGVFSFLATSYAGFLFGIAGMAYGCGSHLFYLIFRKRMKRAVKA